MEVDTLRSQQRPALEPRRAQDLSPLALQVAQFMACVKSLLQLPELGDDPRGMLWIATDVTDVLPSIASETQFVIDPFAAAFRCHATLPRQHRQIIGRKAQPGQFRKRPDRDFQRRGALRAVGQVAGQIARSVSM